MLETNPARYDYEVCPQLRLSWSNGQVNFWLVMNYGLKVTLSVEVLSAQVKTCLRTSPITANYLPINNQMNLFVHLRKLTLQYNFICSIISFK